MHAPIPANAIRNLEIAFRDAIPSCPPIEQLMVVEIRLALHLLSLSDLCRETSLDGGD
jgi:hypothetical protein